MGRTLGDPADPLLVSVRSGARNSMPGMMDTVLNLGPQRRVGRGPRRADRPALRLRLLPPLHRRCTAASCWASTATELESRSRRPRPAAARRPTRDRAGRRAARSWSSTCQDSSRPHTGEPFPQEPQAQLRGAIEAVFRSWNSPRAAAYRAREHIPHDLGTAVNVQSMVFGNRDDRSGTGVGFTRNPATGEAGAYGDFLLNAQGEDVVAGIRNTEPLSAIGEQFPDVYAELLDIYARLERHYRDMLDTEFTIEQGQLWMLQTRVGKRTGAAALRLAVAMTAGPGHPAHARRRRCCGSAPTSSTRCSTPPSTSGGTVLARGLAGVARAPASGRVYFRADDAVDAYNRGEDVDPRAQGDLARGRPRHAGLRGRS